jgi:hypothetical protein
MSHFRSTIDPIEAFSLRGDMLREQFGRWDDEDPICHRLLDLVEAQNEIADAIDDDVNYGFGGDAAIKAAVAKRTEAACKLMAALDDRESWPEPYRSAI